MVWFSVGDFRLKESQQIRNSVDGKTAVARPLKEPPYKSFFLAKVKVV